MVPKKRGHLNQRQPGNRKEVRVVSVVHMRLYIPILVVSVVLWPFFFLFEESSIAKLMWNNVSTSVGFQPPTSMAHLFGSWA